MCASTVWSSAASRSPVPSVSSSSNRACAVVWFARRYIHRRESTAAGVVASSSIIAPIRAQNSSCSSCPSPSVSTSFISASIETSSNINPTERSPKRNSFTSTDPEPSVSISLKSSSSVVPERFKKPSSRRTTCSIASLAASRRAFASFFVSLEIDNCPMRMAAATAFPILVLRRPLEALLVLSTAAFLIVPRRRSIVLAKLATAWNDSAA